MRRNHKLHPRALVLSALALSQTLPPLGLSAVLLSAAPASAVQPAKKAAPARQQQANVTLNFVNAEIEGVARAMAAILDQQIIVDPRVKGTITLYSEQPLTQREAYLNFLAALRGQGFTVVEVAGLLKVVPEAEAKLQTGTVAAGAVPRSGDQVMTQIFRLQHENANNLVTVLRPLISPNNTINANSGNNSLVITDYADNLQRISKIIAAMDVPSSTDLEVIPLKYAIASDVAALVQRFADSGGGSGAAAGGAGGTGGAQAVTVLADPRSNSLLVRAPNPARLSLVRAVADKLDRPGQNGMGGSGIYVVYLKNADATKLATVLRASFSADARAGTGSGGGGSGGGSVSASPASTNMASGLGASNSAAAGGSGTSGASTQSTAPVQGSAAPSTGGFIQADPASNSLIITASEALYRQLRAVIDQLDSRRAQIYVETMIVEMDATKAAEYGFQWQGANGGKYGVAGGTNFTSGTSNILDLSTALATQNASGLSLGGGLNIGILKRYGNNAYSLAALATFLQTKTDSNVLSTPNLVSLDNEEAKITIGQNVPFVTGQYTSNNSSSGSVNPFTTVERKDVGITLRVKPQIGENGTIRMTIYQENSSVVSGTTSSTNGPTTNKSSIETTVVVDDGQVLVLGGLLKDSYSAGREQVPLLGDLPVVGNLFRSDNRSRGKTNLMVFLRPVVLRDQQAANNVTLDRYEVIRSGQAAMQPTGIELVPVGDVPVLPSLRTTDSLGVPPASVPVPVQTVPAPIRNAAPTPGMPVDPVPRLPSKAVPPAPAASDAAVPTPVKP
ncbi:MAG: type II secretion system protein GspD [Aquabacterium sp.]|nr:MAG: type II secretion system protein GspD [Aquabacterium sp.]